MVGGGCFGSELSFPQTAFLLHRQEMPLGQQPSLSHSLAWSEREGGRQKGGGLPLTNIIAPIDRSLYRCESWMRSFPLLFLSLSLPRPGSGLSSFPSLPSPPLPRPLARSLPPFLFPSSLCSPPLSLSLNRFQGAARPRAAVELSRGKASAGFPVNSLPASPISKQKTIHSELNSRGGVNPRKLGRPLACPVPLALWGQERSWPAEERQCLAFASAGRPR